jgi:hypothetical protein
MWRGRLSEEDERMPVRRSRNWTIKTIEAVVLGEQPATALLRFTPGP